MVSDFESYKKAVSFLPQELRDITVQPYDEMIAEVNKQPTVDAVEVEVIKAWLYEMAMNNVGCPVKDFATACEEIISRLDGLRTFEKERRPTNGDV